MPNTIQGCIDDGYSLSVYCEGRLCTHGQTLDLLKLRDQLGPDHSTMHYDIAHKFRCTKCGSRKVSIRISPDHRRCVEEAWAARMAKK